MPKDISAVPTTPDLSRMPLSRAFWRSKGVSIGLLSYSRQVITLEKAWVGLALRYIYMVEEYTLSLIFIRILSHLTWL
jgi:hypothetical protein